MASRRNLALAQWPVEDSGWGVRVLQRAGGCYSFLCWKSGMREHFPASASPSVLLSAAWNDAWEQKFSPAINRGRACDPRGRRADAAHTVSTGMPGFNTHSGLGEGGTSKTVGKKMTSRGSQVKPFCCNLKPLTLRFSSWSSLRLSIRGGKEEADRDAALPCGCLPDAGNPTLSSVPCGILALEQNRGSQVSVPIPAQLSAFTLFLSLFLAHCLCFTVSLDDLKLPWMP